MNALPGPAIVDLQVDIAGIDRVAADVGIAEPRIVEAVAPVAVANRDDPSVARAIQRRAIPIPGIVERIAEAGADNALAPVVDVVVEAHQQVGCLGIAGHVADFGHLLRDEIGIVAEFDSACQFRIISHDGESLALRCRQLRLEARDIGLEAGRASGDTAAEQTQRAQGREKFAFFHSFAPCEGDAPGWGAPRSIRPELL